MSTNRICVLCCRFTKVIMWSKSWFEMFVLKLSGIQISLMSRILDIVDSYFDWVCSNMLMNKPFVRSQGTSWTTKFMANITLNPRMLEMLELNMLYIMRHIRRFKIKSLFGNIGNKLCPFLLFLRQPCYNF